MKIIPSNIIRERRDPLIVDVSFSYIEGLLIRNRGSLQKRKASFPFVFLSFFVPLPSKNCRK